jgi:titin
MRHLIVLTCAVLLLLACGDDGKKKLNKPANLTADVVAEDQVNLIWEDQSRNEAGFEIHRALKGEGFRILTRTNADTTTIKDKTVALGAVYHYRVRAVSGKERSYYSNTAEVEVVVDRDSAPMPPMSLQATEVTASSLILTWVDTSTNETGFEIERSLQEDFSGVEILAADMNETRYEDSQLMPETQYHYRVRAINAVGESAYSQALMVETAAAALALGKRSP